MQSNGLLQFISVIAQSPPVVEDKWLHEYHYYREIHGNRSNSLKKVASVRSLDLYHKVVQYSTSDGNRTGGYISDVSFDSTGSYFAAACLSGHLYVHRATASELTSNTERHINHETLHLTGGMDIGHRIEACKWNPIVNSSELACCFSSYRDILVFDVAVSQAKAICSLQGSDSTRANGGGILDISGGTGVIGGGRDGVLRTWDFRAGSREVMSKNRTVSEGAIQAVCTISPDGSTVATGTEQGQLTLYDMRYFGPPLQDLFLPNVLPVSPCNTQLPATYLPKTKQHTHAIQALASGHSTKGMGHLMAFQLRGGCRVGLYNILSNKIHIVDPSDIPFSTSFSPTTTYHGLTRSRIAFSKIDTTLFYGDNNHELHGVDCGPCVLEPNRSHNHSHNHHHHQVELDNVVTCVDTNASGAVVVGLESNTVILCSSSLVT